MIRLTREADYGIVLMMHFANAQPGVTNNARDLAHASHLPPPMVSKILKRLARGGLLDSQRGAKGGYSLGRAPEQISVAEIITALEGPIALTPCVQDSLDSCSRESICPARDQWQQLNQTVRGALETVSLAEMARPKATGCASAASHEQVAS